MKSAKPHCKDKRHTLSGRKLMIKFSTPTATNPWQKTSFAEYRSTTRPKNNRKDEKATEYDVYRGMSKSAYRSKDVQLTMTQLCCSNKILRSLHMGSVNI